MRMLLQQVFECFNEQNLLQGLEQSIKGCSHVLHLGFQGSHSLQLDGHPAFEAHFHAGSSVTHIEGLEPSARH